MILQRRRSAVSLLFVVPFLAGQVNAEEDGNSLADDLSKQAQEHADNLAEQAQEHANNAAQDFLHSSIDGLNNESFFSEDFMESPTDTSKWNWKHWAVAAAVLAFVILCLPQMICMCIGKALCEACELVLCCPCNCLRCLCCGGSKSRGVELEMSEEEDDDDEEVEEEQIMKHSDLEERNINLQAQAPTDGRMPGMGTPGVPPPMALAGPANAVHFTGSTAAPSVPVPIEGLGMLHPHQLSQMHVRQRHQQQLLYHPHAHAYQWQQATAVAAVPQQGMMQQPLYGYPPQQLSLY